MRDPLPTAAAPTAPADAAPPAPTNDAVALVWRLLTSPRTFVALLMLAALYLFGGAFIPQGASPEALTVRYEFGLAEIIAGLDLHHAVSGWPLLLLALLATLTAVGLGLRVFIAHRATGIHDETGPWVDRAEGVVPGPLAAVRDRLPSLLGGRAVLREGADGVVGRRGLFLEGAVLASLGAVAILAALAVDRAASVDARVTFTPGPMALSQPLYEVRDGDLWIEQVLPWALQCDAPDPLDPLRRHRCRVVGADGVTDVTLRPGVPVTVGDVRVALSHQRARVPVEDRPFDLLIQRPGGDAPARLALAPESTVEVDGGARLTALGGPDGPLVIATPSPDARPVLLAPIGGLRGIEGAGAPPMALGYVPSQRVTASLRTAPERFFLWAGLGLLALGLGLMALRAQLVVRAVAGPDGRVRVVAFSSNRAGAAATLVTALSGTTVETSEAAP